MRNLTKRGLSFVIVLALCVSLLSGMVFTANAATVTYRTDGNYIYNWGTRGTTATFLSPNAEAFYSDNDITYEELSALEGSSTVSSVPSSNLYLELQELMEYNHSYINNYKETNSLYQYTDCENNGTPSTISSFYSGIAIGPDWDSGETWNKEHTWPNSKGLEGSDEDDIMMLRPTSKDENSSRGNTAYGESDSFYDPNDVSGGKYNLHGDVARIALYVYVRWGNTGKMFGSDGVIESKDILLKWMAEDPVDTWELGRNDSVEAITGTRNVFVDYPELAFDLFEASMPTNMTTPSGKAASSGHTVTATSNNEAYGTVTVNGGIITAVPTIGYAAVGYTVTSGSATVSQSGNIFTVSATSDCNIQINFVAKTSTAVKFSENGQISNTVDTYVGDTISLPGHTGTVPAGYTFIGWYTSAVSNTESKPSVLSVGSSFSVTGTTTLYAVYQYAVSGSGSENIVFDFGPNGAASHADGNDVGAEKTFSSGSYSLAITGASKVFDSARDLKGNSTLKLGTSSVTAAFSFEVPSNVTQVTINVAGYKDKKASINVNGTTTAINTVSNNGEYTPVIVDTTTNKTISFSTNSSPDERAMIDSIIYTATTGEVQYYTSFTCKHENTINIPEQPATCTENGYTAGVLCNDCEAYISGHEVIFSEGHKYTPIVTEPTATEQGYTTYQCNNCTDNYIDDYTDPVGETYTVKFKVPEGIDAIADMPCNNRGITLPTAEAPEGYSFLGWVASTVEATTEEPDYLEDGSSYTATANITFHALYTYAEGGSGDATAVFEFGANGSAAHKDGSADKTSYSENVTVDGTNYTLSLTNAKKFYPGSYDAKGNSAIKLGSSSNAGSFTFTVPNEVTSVIIKIAQYKANTTKISVNGTEYTITTASNNGAYTDITVDTSTTKTVSFTTVSGGYRAMMNSITYVIPATGTVYYATLTTDDPEPQIFDVTFNGTNISFNGAATVIEGESYSATLTAAEGYNLPDAVTVTVDGQAANAVYDATSGVVTIDNVTGDIVITAIGVEEPAEFEFSGASLSIENGISVNFKADARLFNEQGYSAPYATFQLMNKTFTAEGVDNGKGQYVFTLYNIQPDWMGELITATLTATLDGEQVSADPIGYSVATYCYNMLNDTESSESLKRLMVDVLNYGAASQAYTGHMAEYPVNGDLTEEQKALATAYTAPESVLNVSNEINGETVVWQGISLFLRETANIRVRFTSDITEGLSLKGTICDQNYTVDQEEILQSGNNYYVYFDHIPVYQMRKEITFLVYENNVAVSEVLTYSVASYAAAMMENAELAPLMQAMLCYGDSAAAYVAANG